MSSFTDTATPPRTWTVTVDVTAIKRVRKMLGLDLLALVQDGFAPLAALLADPVQLVDVLFVLCFDEATDRFVTDEQFGRLMAGDVLEQATEAFLEGLCSFFPDAKVRSALRNLLAKGKAVQTLATAQAEREIEALDPQAILTAVLKQTATLATTPTMTTTPTATDEGDGQPPTYGSSSSSSPASPAATPDR